MLQELRYYRLTRAHLLLVLPIQTKKRQLLVTCQVPMDNKESMMIVVLSYRANVAREFFILIQTRRTWLGFN